jgi:pimeloyl-ACP methyl ester carboxylesterase
LRDSWDERAQESLVDFESIQIRAAGFDLHADVWEGARSEPILLLHGLGGNSVTWRGVAPLVAKSSGARVLAVDLPGFGRSHPHGKRVGLRELASIVADLVAREAPSGARWHIAGNSLGGLLALEAACALPERVSQVTLAAVALPLVWGRGPRELLGFRHYFASGVPWLGRKLVAHYIRTTGVPGVVDEPIRFLFGDPARLDPELRLRLLEVSRFRMTWIAEAARVLEEATRSLGAAVLRPSAAERWIRQARCPVQSLYGNRDPLYPPSAWQHLERVRPDWQHVLLPNMGHVPQLEAPAAFASHMLAAIAR